MSRLKDDQRGESVREQKLKVELSRRKRLVALAVFGGALLVTVGVFAKNGWFPSTDTATGRKTGWFGSKSVPSTGFLSSVFPNPTPTPQLAKEYVYAGSRLLSVVDANAQEAPPADLAVWRPSTGGWWVMGGQWSAQISGTWGISTDEPMEGDYDGDGKTDFAVWRKIESSQGAGDVGNWYIVYSGNSTTAQYPFGQTGDVPVQADFNGDGTTDSGVFRGGTWHIRYSGSGTVTQQQFGLSTDKVAPADYDGDGRADIGVWRDSDKTFYSLNSSNGSAQIVSMSPQTGTVVSSDYDGDGKADQAIRNGATWVIRKSSDQSVYSVTPQGDIASDIPVQNDYDGDGKTDIAVWRAIESATGAGDVGKWYIRQSASGTARTVQWGISGDIPVPALYRR